MSAVSTRVSVAVDTPLHAGLDSVLSYCSERLLTEGTLLRVPLGRREVSGIVWAADVPGATDAASEKIRGIAAVCDAIEPFSAAWRALVDFAAAYYQRGVGEIALSALPVELRRLDNAGLAKRLARARKLAAEDPSATPGDAPVLSDEQAAASERIAAAR